MEDPLPKKKMDEEFSDLFEVELGPFCERYQINLYNPKLPGKKQSVNKPPEGMIGVYRSFFEFANLRLPFSPFVKQLLGYYNLHICQLSPKGVAKMVSFELLCAALNLKPTVPLFRKFLHLAPNGEWFTFSNRKHQSLIVDGTTKLHTWKKKFFFISIDCEMFMRKLGPVHDRMPKIGTYEETAAEILTGYTFNIAPLPQEVLWKAGLTCFKHEDDKEPTSRPPEINASFLLGLSRLITKKESNEDETRALDDEDSAKKMMAENPCESLSISDYKELGFSGSLIEGEQSLEPFDWESFWEELAEDSAMQSNKYLLEDPLEDINEEMLETDGRCFGFYDEEPCEKQPAEVQKVLDMDAMEDAHETLNKSNVSENQTGANRYEMSNLGAVQSIGSDLTRTKDKSDLQQNVSNSSEPILSKMREKQQNTSNNQPIASVESYAAGPDMGIKEVIKDDKMDTVVCSGQSTLSKRSRKASTVNDLFLQYSMKRQKVNEV